MTRNEEVNIERCLASVRWSNDVLVLDAYSEDQTVELARAFPNVRIVERAFDNFGSQRNFGLHQIEYRNSWLLVLDADEVVEPALAQELQELAGQQPPPPFDVFLLRRKVFMNGRWLRRNITFDFWIERVMRPKAVRYVGVVHERLRFEGGYGRLQGALEHHQFSKGVDDWLARRLHYAEVEARSRSSDSEWIDMLRGFLNSSTLKRKAALKSLFLRLPARWAIYFIYNVVFKRTYLDGIAGLRYVYLESYSHYRAARVLKEKPIARLR